MDTTVAVFLFVAALVCWLVYRYFYIIMMFSFDKASYI